jgi:hypothetical protein
MNSRIRNRAGSRGWLLRRGGVSALVLGVLVLGLLVPGAPAWARGGGGWQRHTQAARAGRPAPAARPQAQGRPGAQGRARPAPARRIAPGTGRVAGVRPGQPHLPQWLAQHQNLTPAQQENLLRREPGFSRLTANQQRRVMNQLRFLDSRPPAYRQRLAQRNEAFERLSPEGKQDVRAAAQAFRQMPPGRQMAMRQAFNDLRQLPPQQREEILSSARFTHTFTPQERHVLGSMLSIEPYPGAGR